jgi:hypothetical protein
MQQDSISPVYMEQLKLAADFLKHITTLSTGSIVLLTIFLEKLFRGRPHWKILIGLSLGGFTLSLIASLVAFTGVLLAAPSAAGHISLKASRIPWVVGTMLTLAGFLLGSISLTAFAIKNLYKRQLGSSESATQE